jgi:hypothetical protein
MKKVLVFLCMLLAGTLLCYGAAGAHSGGLDSQGGHYNRKTVEYHYHRGGSGNLKSKVTRSDSKSERKTKSTKPEGSKKKSR